MPAPKKPSGWVWGTVRFLWRPVLILAVAGALAVWILGLDLTRRRVQVQPPPEVVVDAPPPERRWAPRERKVPTPGCTEKAERKCILGDAWWLDSCGTAYTKAQECGERRCIDTACEDAGLPDCGGIGALGRCDGNVAQACVAGKITRIDCAELDRRCVMTEDAPACRPSTPDDCDPTPPWGPTRCEDDVLVACVEGTLQRFDCRIRGGTCGPRVGSGAMGCIVTTPPAGAAQCGVCGCPLETGDELCDGRDNDADGFVDEDDNCGEIPIEVFVVADASGNSSFTDEDVQREVQRINRFFARDDDLGLTFRVAGIHGLAQPDWLTLDDRELDEVTAQGMVHPARDEFYVPLLLTDEIVIDDVPRPGASTVPNGACGGVRRTELPQSPIGVVALAKRRWPSTGAHELGHYFGLCHTHTNAVGGTEWVEPTDDGGAAKACQEPCAYEADGICDTAPDPGPPVCHADPGCGVTCEDGQSPDPTNVMAYYPDCREHFTVEQARWMHTTLYLRRSWHACIWGEGCPCDPAAPDCPEQMTCRNFTDEAGQLRWNCGVEGAARPRAPCDNNLDCSSNSVCVRAGDGDSLCVRTCGPATPDCDCQEVVSFGAALCMADFEL